MNQYIKFFVFCILISVLIPLARFYSKDIYAYLYYTPEQHLSDIIQQYHYYKNDCDGIEILMDFDETIYINIEKINIGHFNCLKKLLKNKKELFIHSSGGGNSLEATLISNYIQENDITVYSVNNCFSSCVKILFSAKRSFVCYQSAVGTHQLSTHNNINFIFINNSFYKAENALFKKFNHKFNTEYYNLIIQKTSFNDFYIFSQEELIENHFITDLVNC